MLNKEGKKKRATKKVMDGGVRKCSRHGGRTKPTDDGGTGRLMGGRRKKVRREDMLMGWTGCRCGEWSM